MAGQRIEFPRFSVVRPHETKIVQPKKGKKPAKVFDLNQARLLTETGVQRRNSLWQREPALAMARHEAAIAAAFDLKEVAAPIRGDVATILAFAESDDWKQMIQTTLGIKPKSE